MNGDARGMENPPDFIQLPPNSPLADSGRHGTLSRDYHSSRSGRDDRRDRDRDRGGDRDRDRDRRRRSRSPHRGSRRDFENDAYSSSRHDRAREREDRHGLGHRDGDRDGWDRDRGGRRDRREDDRSRRNERDPYDDRRRRDRDERRDASPPKKREPTPDLTNIVSVLERKRRNTQWDVKPIGYDMVTAEQAKLSGMFPLPGAPRQQPVDQSRLQALLQQPGGAASAASLLPVNSRVSRRLVILHVPASVTEQALTAFINLQLNEFTLQPDPCLSSTKPPNATWALATFRTPEEATVALHFAMSHSFSMPEHASNGNGVTNGAVPALAFSRPKDYIEPTTVENDLESDLRLVGIRDTPYKIVITHVPQFIDDNQAKELLHVYGNLKAFSLLRNKSTGESAGIVFCEYEDPAITEIAIENLNGMAIGESSLKVERACIGIKQTSLEMSVNALNMLARGTGSGRDRGRVLQLHNMVTPDELMDTEEYEEIHDDVHREVQKYGTVLQFKMPRPAGARSSPGVGKIFIKFETHEMAQKALASLGGRKFSDRTVVAAYYDEEQFDVDAW